MRRPFFYSLASFFIAVLGALIYFKDHLRETNITVGAAFGAATADLSGLQLPAGYDIAVFANLQNSLRQLNFGADGWLFVGSRSDKVYALRDTDGDGTADETRVIAAGLRSPHGVVVHNGDLYIGEIPTIYRVKDITAQLAGGRITLSPFIRGLPTSGHHGMRHLGIGGDGHLYVSYGVPCNICEPAADELAGVIRRYDTDADAHTATDGEVVARGIRNAVGFDFHPVSDLLWFTDNGRDWLGDEKPHDELNVVSETGEHFGYPYCHQGDMIDPELGDADLYPCGSFTAPVLNTGPHVANLGMVFDPAGETVFIALHGSWNRSEKIGYAVWRAAVAGNTVADYEPFVSGWLNESTGEVSGRPVDVAIGENGDVYISDDYAGLIYRVFRTDGGEAKGAKNQTVTPTTSQTVATRK